MKRYNDEDLFSAALALPAVERKRYLERACGNDQDMLDRLQSLLGAFDDAASFVKERSVVAQAGSIGDQIGDYRLLHELGEGGYGVVYLAKQMKPIKRHVALKVIKLGMDTKAVIARFEAERQALALMDHSNIAKVFDAGATTTGRPYFVMELVRGIKITDYCDQVRLTVDERVALFIQVCQAIQHAHYQGIIHRDIKPSNVLVTLHDGVPVAKVIDFGIAKATQGRLTEHTLHTVLEQFVGTPAYVSPEQTTPDGLEIDTRSDIYSLGVLLYELLIGCTPFDTAELMQAGLDGLRKRIREEEPPRPSKRLSALSDEQMTPTTAARKTGCAKLIQQLHGDLDWIVMRCLEKDRTRRYQSANDLNVELQRYLRHEPVLARPPSVAYSIRKFARRHQLIFAAGLASVVFVLFIIAFAITMSIQAQRIASERDRAEQEKRVAEQASAFMLNVISATDPYEAERVEVTDRKLLERAATIVREDLNQNSEINARLLEAIGRAYRRRGEVKRSLGYLQDAVRIRRQMRNVDAPTMATALTELGMALAYIGDSESAITLLEEGITIAQQHSLDQSPIYARLLRHRGWIELDKGRVPEAQQLLERSLALFQASLGPRCKEAAEVLLTLTSVALWKDEFQEAERTAREAIAIFEVTVPPTYPNRILAKSRLGEVLYFQNRLSEAERLFLESLEEQTPAFGKNSREVAVVLELLAMIKHSQGLLDQAETFGRQAVSARIAARGKENDRSAYARTLLATILLAEGKFDKAEGELRLALDTLAAMLPADHQYIASAEHFLGEVLLQTNRLTEAEARLTNAMNRWKRANAPEWRAARSANSLGEVLHRQGHLGEAERYLTESYRTLAHNQGVDIGTRTKARKRVERFYDERGQRDKFEALMLATRSGRNPTPSG